MFYHNFHLFTKNENDPTADTHILVLYKGLAKNDKFEKGFYHAEILAQTRRLNFQKKWNSDVGIE